MILMISRLRRHLPGVAVTLTLLTALPALAVVDGHKFAFTDPAQAQRFQSLAEELRCPKCQNQDLADSSAPVAADMREKMYELMMSGKSDEEIEDYLVARYGDFVRYKPPMRPETWLLWFGPAAAFVAGLLILMMIRRGRSAVVAPLTEEEKARLAALRASQSGSDEEYKA
jgi:cytochrome c-type biogenesis protein CcmH